MRSPKVVRGESGEPGICDGDMDKTRTWRAGLDGDAAIRPAPPETDRETAAALGDHGKAVKQ